MQGLANINLKLMTKNAMLHYLIWLISFNLWAGPTNDPAATLEIHSILRLELNSSINPASYNYLVNGIQTAQKQGHQLVLIELNTPGGLVSTTKDILNRFGQSTVPIAIWIRPEGASATSAGALIASGAHILVMAKGTNIGAATPVQMGGDISKDLRSKAINDLVALVQGLAKLRNRNSELFTKMITEASSYEAGYAFEHQLIDGVASTRADFLKILDNKKINLLGIPYQLKVISPEFTELPMDLGQRLLNIFSDPQMAYILFIIGAALLYLELQAPGGFIAGSVGVLCLILAAIGFQVLPLNFGALGLIILAFILFVLEVYVTSYALLSIAGVGALITGSLFLYRTDDAYITMSKTVIFSAVSAVILFLIFLVGFIVKDQHKVGKEKFNSLIGKQGIIIDELLELTSPGQYWYQVKISGEMWKLKSSTPLLISQTCLIKGQDPEDLALLI